MPMIKHYTVTASVEFAVSGPYAYSEAVALAEESLGRLAVADKPLNGIKGVRIATVGAEEN